MAISKKLRQEVYDKYNGHCAYCGKEIEIKDMQVDHLAPVYHGGTDTIDNLMPSCRRCNHYKRSASLEVFRSNISKIPEKLMRDSYIFKVGVDYGLFSNEVKDIIFYFEELEVNNE